jgi:uncharacterized protein YqgC (DUF456 family)
VDAAGTFLIALVMLAGVIGVIVPVLPGLVVVWGAGLAWVLLDGGGAGRWAVLAVMSVIGGAGVAAKYVLPGRSSREGGAPWSTLAWGVVGAVAGFFAIPVLGLLIGGLVGIYLAEYARLRTPAAARDSTLAVAKAVGVGILLELVAGVFMILTWAVGVAVT